MQCAYYYNTTNTTCSGRTLDCPLGWTPACGAWVTHTHTHTRCHCHLCLTQTDLRGARCESRVTKQRGINGKSSFRLSQLFQRPAACRKHKYLLLSASNGLNAASRAKRNLSITFIVSLEELRANMFEASTLMILIFHLHPRMKQLESFNKNNH